MAGNRIDYDSKGVDDVAINNVEMFRMEWMDDGCVWICLCRPNGEDVVFWLNSARHIEGRHEYDGDRDPTDIAVNIPEPALR